jgi:hypothetical protein
MPWPTAFLNTYTQIGSLFLIPKNSRHEFAKNSAKVKIFKSIFRAFVLPLRKTPFSCIEFYSFERTKHRLLLVTHSTVLNYPEKNTKQRDGNSDLRIPFSSLLPELFPETWAVFDPQHAGIEGARQFVSCSIHSSASQPRYRGLLSAPKGRTSLIEEMGTMRSSDRHQCAPPPKRNPLNMPSDCISARMACWSLSGKVTEPNWQLPLNQSV